MALTSILNARARSTDVRTAAEGAWRLHEVIMAGLCSAAAGSVVARVVRLRAGRTPGPKTLRPGSKSHVCQLI